MHVVHILNQLVEHHQGWAYLVIYLGLIFEGEVVVICASILATLGALNFYMVLSFVIGGMVTKVFSFYYLGIYLKAKFHRKKIVQYIEKKVSYIMPNFEKKPFWSIFLSTFIMGAGYVVMLFSGYKKVDFKTYLKAEFLSIIIWAPLMLFLGYFFGYTALSITKEFSKFSLIVILLVLGFVFFDKFISWLYRTFIDFSARIE
ncbi:hypothetical protein K2P96_01285 [Patescibacteria group bacterium]|nr:hypothetical protein [Patescibacteria group bacterium]